MSSKKRFEGYLLTDHRSGPGIPGLGFANSSVVEVATLWCCHCSACFVPNPDRDRQRGYCRTCDKYLCDPCVRRASQSDYIHQSFFDIAEKVKSGRYMIVGPMSDQCLVPVPIYAQEVILHG